MEDLTTPVFLSYAKRDIEAARQVYQWLTRNGISCWMDERSLRAGEDWKKMIDKAIQASQIFLACLSTKSVTHRGFVQTELKTAYEVWKTVPSDQVFLLPLRLDECEVPSEIQSVHYLDFFAADGPAKLLSDITHQLAPRLPNFRLREALEHIRLGRLDEALSTLMQLKVLVDDRSPDLRLRVLYDIACTHSLRAERAIQGRSEKTVELDAALAHLKEWFAFGSSGAWAGTGRTAENEIYRMGSDHDLLCLIKDRASEVKQLFGSLAAALPTDPPKRRSPGGGGGCVPLTQSIETPGGAVRFEDLRVGMVVRSRLTEAGARPVDARIVRTYSSREPDCVIINSRAVLTVSQPLLDATNQWKRAGELEPGDRLMGAESQTLVVKSVERIAGYFEVGTLTTDHPSHNFVCGDLICGNKKY